jgi:hypothetical protein
MNQMRYVGDGLKGNLGAVEGAPARGSARSEEFVASFLPIQVRLRLIRGATRLVQDLLDL